MEITVPLERILEALLLATLPLFVGAVLDDLPLTAVLFTDFFAGLPVEGVLLLGFAVSGFSSAATGRLGLS